MINIKEHLSRLGLPVRDRVTGLKGVVTSISFDLYGCVQAIVHPGLNKDSGRLEDPIWFDMNRLEVTGTDPVMEVPDFEYGPIAEGKKGPADKPRSFKS